MKHAAYLLVIISALACTNPFAPRLTDTDLNATAFLTEQKEPIDVLTNFRYAYTFKDSLIYSEVLDSSFLFISKNYSTSPPTDIVWGRDEDLQTTAALFRHFNTLELNWGGVLIDRPGADSLNWEIKITFQLTLDGGREIPPLKGEALFEFLRHNDGVWRISRWDDLSSF